MEKININIQLSEADFQMLTTVMDKLNLSNRSETIRKLIRDKAEDE